MPIILPRALSHRMARLHAPVVILEGARAVGKTTMVRRQFEADRGYSYSTFADRSTRERAAADMAAWLRSLRLPAIIDEAQLLPSLPLELKELVDTLPAGQQVVLTGSATIGRAGLGGADPLTRRSQRLTMHPITVWERRAQPGSLVDLLFEGAPRIGRYRQEPDAALSDALRVGGFPQLLYPDSLLTRRGVRDQIASDLNAVLSDMVLPDLDFNVNKARAVLDALLRAPGGILNATALGRQLEIDRRTVDRNLGVFDRLFLLQGLPNLATAPRSQGLSRAKMHPFDVSFSFDALERARIDILERREFFGQLIESYVVGNLLAAVHWAETAVRPYYWRQASRTNPEVDLVLLDDAGRSVAVEVKAATSVSSRDLTGIRALKESRGLHRGFVFYRGDEVVQLSESVWALPLSVLGDADAFENPVQTVDSLREIGDPIVLPPAPSSDRDATVFLSYVHADDEAQKGRIVKFAEDLVATYSFLYGRELQLFIDRDDIAWGDDWRARLDREIGATSFLLAAVTPRYLRSDACRKEVLSFSAAAQQAGEPRLLLPLQWVDIAQTDVVPEDDPVRQRLAAVQYEDVSAIRRVQPDSIEYEQLVERVAGRLRRTIEARLIAEPAVAVSVDEGDDSSGVVDLMSDLAESQVELESDISEFKRAFEAVAAEFQREPMPSRVPSAVIASTLDRLGDRLTAPSDELEKATNALGASWRTIDGIFSKLVRLSPSLPASMRVSLYESLGGLERATVIEGTDQFEAVLTMMSAMSRRLRPASRALEGSLQVLRGIHESAAAWREGLGDVAASEA